MDEMDAQDMLAEMRIRRMECPHCLEPFEHFSGLENIPEYYYCPGCLDWAYSENGDRLFRLE